MGEVTATHTFYEVFKTLLPFLLIIGGFILSVIIVTKYKVPKLETDIKEQKDKIDSLEKEVRNMATRDELLKAFLDPAGNTRFQLVAGCGEYRRLCGSQNSMIMENLGEKIEGVGDRMMEAMEELDRKRAEKQGENSKRFDDLTEMIKETNEKITKTDEKLQGVAQEVKIMSNGKKYHDDNDAEEMARKIAKKLAKELRNPA